jgi:Uma2 family endonuclease
MQATATLNPMAAAVDSVKEDPLYEIVNGLKVESPPMSIYAAWIASRLQSRMGSFVEAHGLGIVVTEGLFILDPVKDLRRRPDVAFVSVASWPLTRPLPETGDWQTIPDLAVEIISPNDVFQDVLAKMREYFRLGVKQVWIVLPVDREIYVYDSPKDVRILTADDELDGGTLLPGLRLPVGSIFQRQPRTAPDGAAAAR